MALLETRHQASDSAGGSLLLATRVEAAGITAAAPKQGPGRPAEPVSQIAVAVGQRWASAADEGCVELNLDRDWCRWRAWSGDRWADPVAVEFQQVVSRCHQPPLR